MHGSRRADGRTKSEVVGFDGIGKGVYVLRADRRVGRPDRGSEVFATLGQLFDRLFAISEGCRPP